MSGGVSAPASVLLLHGQPGSARDWDRVCAALPPRVVPIAIDRPGWDGQSLPASLDENALAAVAALDDRDVERATVVGHSLGAAVAAWLAVNHPSRVSGLVLASPAANAAALDWIDQLLAMPVAGALASAAALSGVGLALTTAPLRRRIARELELDDDYLGAAARGLLTPGAWRAFATEQRALVREIPELEGRLGRISTPTTVVYGSADRVVPPGSARRLADQIPGAEVVVLEGAGHLLPQRRARRLAEVIAASAA